MIIKFFKWLASLFGYVLEKKKILPAWVQETNFFFEQERVNFVSTGKIVKDPNESEDEWLKKQMKLVRDWETKERNISPDLKKMADQFFKEPDGNSPVEHMLTFDIGGEDVIPSKVVSGDKI